MTQQAQRAAKAQMIAAHLKIQPGQHELTPEQAAEAQHFVLERVRAQSSTEPVDEQEAETFLRQAYQVAKLPPPERIQWVESPLEFVTVLVSQNVPDSIEASVWDRVKASVRNSLDSVGGSVRNSIWDSLEDSLEDIGGSVWASVEDGLLDSVPDSVRERVGASLWDAIVEASIWAYSGAVRDAYYRFFDAYLAPNDLHALVHFNELVSGYWLGQEVALVVRRPRVLARDPQGRLHSATGKCLEYHNGWGSYAWHGVRVPERVILTPEALTRTDFLSEPNVEVRRVIEERMGQRFVPELGGVVLDSGPRGTLYEVRLPEGDPEGVARYVQVQDVSTSRQYFLRVPPTVQTAAEAVAWSFQLAAEAYDPAQET
jgi:hypothetical protein